MDDNISSEVSLYLLNWDVRIIQGMLRKWSCSGSYREGHASVSSILPLLFLASQPTRTLCHSIYLFQCDWCPCLMTAWKIRPSKALRHSFALSLVDGLLAQAASFCLSVTESPACHDGLVNHISACKNTEAVSTFHSTWHLFTAVTNSNHSFIRLVISANIP